LLITEEREKKLTLLFPWAVLSQL